MGVAVKSSCQGLQNAPRCLRHWVQRTDDKRHCRRKNHSPFAIHQPDTIQRATTHCVCMYRHAPLTGRKQAVECTQCSTHPSTPLTEPTALNPTPFFLDSIHFAFISCPGLLLKLISDLSTMLAQYASRVYVTVGRPSVCLTAATAAYGFAAERRVGRRYRSIAAGVQQAPTLSNKYG